MGLVSVEGRFTGASGLGVTVTRGWMVPGNNFDSVIHDGIRKYSKRLYRVIKIQLSFTRLGFIVIMSQVAKLMKLICETVNCVNKTMRLNRLWC